MRKRKADPTSQLVVLMVQKIGMRDAVKVGTLIVQWGTLAQELGREPTHEEFCDYWQESRSTYYRALAHLRRIWPEDKSPQRVWLWVESQLPAGVGVDVGVASLFTLGVP